MRPVATTLGNYVVAPVERVFQLLTDPARFPDWLPGCSSAEPAGPVKKGSQLNVRFGTRHTTFEIVDCSAPYTFGWVERGARQGCKTFFQLDFAGSLTGVTIQDVWEPPQRVVRKTRPHPRDHRALSPHRLLLGRSRKTRRLPDTIQAAIRRRHHHHHHARRVDPDEPGTPAAREVLGAQERKKDV